MQREHRRRSFPERKRLVDPEKRQFSAHLKDILQLRTTLTNSLEAANDSLEKITAGDKIRLSLKDLSDRREDVRARLQLVKDQLAKDALQSSNISPRTSASKAALHDYD